MRSPEQVVVSVTEIAGPAKEGLLALEVGTGLQVMAAMFDEDVTQLCGPDGKHNADRSGYRHGSEDGSVTLGGRRLAVTRPRVRAADGSGELHLPSYDLSSSTKILTQLALEKMLGALSSRRYPHGLEPAGQVVERAASSTSKSADSRQFVAPTETAAATSPALGSRSQCRQPCGRDRPPPSLAPASPAAYRIVQLAASAQRIRA